MAAYGAGVSANVCSLAAIWHGGWPASQRMAWRNSLSEKAGLQQLKASQRVKAGWLASRKLATAFMATGANGGGSQLTSVAAAA